MPTMLVPPDGARNSARLSEEARQQLARRLRELCAPNLSSSRRLHAASGVAIGTCEDLLNGRTDPRLGTLLAIAEALALHSLEELFAPLGTERLIGLQASSSEVA